MNRLKLLAMATLMALTITACDEGEPPITDIPPPPTPVGTISGTVTIDGTGATGITATLSSGATTATGAGGTFSFAGVEAGSYTVTISGYPADAAFPSATQAATIASDGQTVQLNFAGEYIRSSSVVGKVVAADPMMMGSDSNGDGWLGPLDGITVTLEGEHTMAEPQHTMEGGFAFTGLRAGSYTVTISGYPDDVMFDEASMTVEVGVGEVGMADFEGAYIRTAAVEGRVVIDGDGLAGVTVTLTGGPGNDNYTKLTGADGGYAFTELRPGDYQVSISGYDPDDYEFASSSRDVSVELDETETVSFTGVLLRTSGISGRVSVAGTGLPDIAVTLSGAADATRMTDASGQYAFAGLAAGDYTVSIAGFDADAYVFDSMSSDRTVGDDDSQIVNFEGAHATTASVSGMLFIDELTKNDMHDAGEHPLAQAGIPVALVGPGVNEQRLGATGPDGSFSFPGLRAGPYQLIVPIGAQVAAALAAADLAYGGPAAGYAFVLGVGEVKTQAVPFDITHTTINVAVTLKGGEHRGMPIPGASVTLYSDAAGTTQVGSGETEVTAAGVFTSVRVTRAGTSDNTVHMAVSTEGYFVDPTAGMQAVTWNPQSPVHPAPDANPPAVLNDADIVNLNVDVSVSGATVTTEYGGGDALAGWAIAVLSGSDPTSLTPVEDAVLDEDGNAAFTATVAPDALPAVYTFAVAPDQLDAMDGGEAFKGTPATYVHTGLSLAATMDAGSIEVAYTTQTLKVYVHHELDQVEGYTGNILGGDERDDDGVISVDLRYIDDSGRSRSFTKAVWDADENTSSSKGAWTFSHVPADAKVVAQAEEDADANVKLLDDEVPAYRNMEENGVTGGAFGDMGGFSHTVSLCPLQGTNPQDHDECSSFAYVSLHAVSGLVWKKDVTVDSKSDGFVVKDPTFVPGITVALTPVEGKNLAGDEESYTSAEKDDRTDKTKGVDPTHVFDFGAIASGAYKLSYSSGWRAKSGDKGSEVALANALNPLGGNLSIDVTPATGLVYGRVTDGDGFPVDSVTVTANGVPTMSDAEGRYIIDGISPETRKIGSTTHRNMIFVETAQEGHGATRSIIPFAANSPQTQAIALSGVGSTASVSGTVRASGSNAPVAGVEITVDGNAPQNAATSGTNKGKLVTGADGTYAAIFAAKDIGATATVRASKAGMTFVPAELAAPAHADSEISGLDFVGFVNATIRGRVVAPGGGPMSGVTVTATTAADADATATATYTTGTTGTFSLNVPFGSYKIEASLENHTFTYPRTGQVVNVAPGQNVSFGSIRAIADPPPPPPNDPPAFTSPAAFSAAENQTAAGTVVAADPDAGDAVTGYAITGGADMAMLSIDAAPDYEAPGDANGDNAYEVTVEATSGVPGRVLSASQGITVAVTDVDESLPLVTLVLDPSSITENGGVSRISATVSRASATAFDVTVSAAAVSPAVAGDFILSNNMTLSFAANAASSSGAVSITAVNDNDYAADKTVTVSGTVASNDVRSPAGVVLTITEDDVKPPHVQSSDATLSSLSLSDVELNPAFSSDMTSYTASVANDIAETTVAAMANHDSAQVAIVPNDANTAAGHQIALDVGENEITVIVTAEDGTRQDHTVMVTRVPLSANANLSMLIVDGTPVTAGADGTYAHSVGHDVMEATVVGMAEHADATVSYYPSDGDDSDGSTIALDVGDNMLTVKVTAANGTDDVHYSVNVTRAAPPPPPNDPPAFTSPAAFSAAENQTAAGTVVAADPDDAVTGYAITGGADMAMLSIDELGVLTFNAAPDFEAPGDANGDNSYEVTVQATSGVPGRVLSAEQGITVAVTDVDERVPQVTLVLDPSSINENGGVSRIGATVDPVSATAFDVTVSAAAVSPAVAGDFILSNNMTLSFAANAESSSGAVSITAVNNNDYVDGKTVTVSGTVSGTGVTAPADVVLTIEEDDVAPPASDDVSLAKFTVNDGTADTDVMADAGGVYAHSVDNSVMQVTVSATAGHADAMAEITSPADVDDTMDGHQVDLVVGGNDIEATVTAEDGSTDEHTLTVTRAQSSDVSLARFVVTVGEADPVDVVANADDEYVYKVTGADDQVTVAAMAGHALATAEITSPEEDADDMTDGHQVDLEPGANDIEATVTAEDGTEAMYELTVTRTAAAIMISSTDVDEEGEPTLTLGEGETHTYLVRLATMPEANVTVTITAASGLAVDKTSLQFAPENWNVQQGVEITAEEDPTYLDAEGLIVGHVAESDDPEYGDPAKTQDVTVDVTDDDVENREITITVGEGDAAVPTTFGTATLMVDEDAADDATFTVELGTGEGEAAAGEPLGNVTVTIAVPADVRFSVPGAMPADGGQELALTFTPANFRTPQTVTVDPMDDDIESASAVATLVVTAKGGGYNDEGTDVDGDDGEIAGSTVNVDVTIVEDDAAGITVSPTALQLVEGTNDSYTVTLDSDPGGILVITATSGDAAATVAPPTLTFNSSNWMNPQEVTVTAVDNELVASNVVTTIEHEVVANEGNGYSNAELAFDDDDVDLTVVDDETAQIVLKPAGLTIEQGGSQSYDVSLTLAPETDETVTINVSAAAGLNITEGAVLTFDAGNWETAQTVTIGVPASTGAGTLNVTHALVTDGDSDTATYVNNGSAGTVVVTVTSSS